MATLTDKHLELLRDKNFAVVATVCEDGSPQTSVQDFHTPTNRVIVRVRPERVFDYGVSDPSL